MNISSRHPTQTLLTLLLSMDLITLQGVSLRNNSHRTTENHLQQSSIFRKISKAMQVKRVSKIGYTTNLYFSFTPI